jgi:hypothetical protein
MGFSVKRGVSLYSDNGRTQGPPLQRREAIIHNTVVTHTDKLPFEIRTDPEKNKNPARYRAGSNV